MRWSVPGDDARIEDDGTITLLGRGSVSINTGGEKVYPEEVEAALKADPDVMDAIVVGVPDARWGERVVAVDPAARRRTRSTADELDRGVRTHVAGYKAPRDILVVDAIVRSPSGKPDYRWGKATAISRLAEPSRHDERSMTDLATIAPAFVEMAHRIVWCSVATVDPTNRPRSRVLHPIWEWDGTTLTGWIATGPDTGQARAPRAQPVRLVQLLGAEPRHLRGRVPGRRGPFDDETCIEVWDRFKHGPAPVGYDPAIIPPWRTARPRTRSRC